MFEINAIASTERAKRSEPEVNGEIRHKLVTTVHARDVNRIARTYSRGRKASDAFVKLFFFSFYDDHRFMSSDAPCESNC